jgi:hypothetical protein
MVSPLVSSIFLRRLGLFRIGVPDSAAVDPTRQQGSTDVHELTRCGVSKSAHLPGLFNIGAMPATNVMRWSPACSSFVTLLSPPVADERAVNIAREFCVPAIESLASRAASLLCENRVG